ncbi:hypothetical protein QUH73_14520 [Labilibaculum sp. K2S]|nr:hypothetical protein [Labilibaculum sp. K2S]MDM8161036.1 hypothetical protein [Labilibaculum sp. K2S]
MITFYCNWITRFYSKIKRDLAVVISIVKNIDLILLPIEDSGMPGYLFSI